MVKRVVFGEVTSDGVAALQDVDAREFLVLGVLTACVLLIGIWPAPLVDVLHASVENLLRHIVLTKL
jgi:NADH-quinone oxidoreductase subunit M